MPLRLVVRDPGRAPRLPGAQLAVAEHGDPDAVATALAGVETVFMVSASESLDRVDRHRRFVDGALRAGVRHLVYTSFVGAGPSATFTLARDHGATEDYVRASGVSHTFLRDNLYADFLPLMLGEDKVLRGPAGTGRVAAVALDDVADVAAAVLQDPEAHEGATYDLTGPAAHSFAELARILTAALGHEVVYRDETLEEAYASRAAFGAPSWQVDAWVSTYTAIAAGELAEPSTAVETITGHPAIAFSELFRPLG